MMTAQYQAALHSYAEGRYEEAMQQFSELLYEDPRNPKLHIWLGATFRKAGKIEYAKVQYQQVLTLTDDPDLLDLASTSLAQIQNKLAQGLQKSGTNGKEVQKDAAKSTQKESAPAIAARASREVKGKYNGGHATLDQGGITDDDATLLASTPDATPLAPNDRIKAKVVVQSSNGIVPPPPAIAALIQNQQQEINPDQQDSEPFVCSEEATQPATTSSILQETITNLQNGQQKNNGKGEPKFAPQDDAESEGDATGDAQSNTKSNPKGNQKNNSRNGKRENPQKVDSRNRKTKKQTSTPSSVAVVPVTSGLAMDSHDNQMFLRDSNGSSAIALEDILKFSSVGQKITLWGALVATIPAIILGIAAYRVGDSLLLGKIKQNQQLEAIAIANATSNLLQEQTNDVGVLKTLLVSAELGQNILQTIKPNAGQSAGNGFITTNPSETNKSGKLLSSLPIEQQRQYKQLLTNRLNLYKQAYPQYSSISLFSINGELLAQSSNSKTLQTINPNILSKVASVDNVLVTNPVANKEGNYFYATTSVKSSLSPQTSMILQVEVPVKVLTSYLAKNSANVNSSSNFYIIDSTNKYITSSQPATMSGDASVDFVVLENLRSSASIDVVESNKGDRNAQILAYAPIGNIQSYGIKWDVLTTLDKAIAVAGNQNLLLVIGGGIAATPLLVATLAYALSRGLSTRLKDIRAALRDLRQGNTDSRFAALSTEGNDEIAEISLSINKMSEQFQIMMQKHEQEKQRLQLQVVKLFRVLSKLAREEKKDLQEADLSDENILLLGQKVRGEMVQRNAEVESYRQQKSDLQAQLMQMLRDMQSLADGDLTVSTRSIDGNLTDVVIFFDDVKRGLQNIVSQVKTSASQVNLSLGQNEQAIANLTNVAQRQLDTVTRSLNTAQISKLSANTITTNSQQIIQSSQLVATKLSDSDRSIDAVVAKVSELQNTVANTAKRVKHLGETSQKIAKAMSSINEIAIKTNFLAINASLEASRTGNLGNGFVMVAEEVGELATRSVAATKEVESLLMNIQSETNAVMSAVESGSNQVIESNTLAIAAKDSLLEISQISQQIDSLVTSISDATMSQVQTSEGVANLMKDISHIARRNLDTSEEVSKFLKTTKKYAGDLQQSLAHFKTR